MKKFVAFLLAGNFIMSSGIAFANVDEIINNPVSSYTEGNTTTFILEDGRELIATHEDLTKKVETIDGITYDHNGGTKIKSASSSIPYVAVWGNTAHYKASNGATVNEYTRARWENSKGEVIGGADSGQCWNIGYSQAESPTIPDPGFFEKARTYYGSW